MKEFVSFSVSIRRCASSSIIQMKLKYIDGPYGYARDVKALEIFENAVNNSKWLDENDSLVSGDMVGFNFGDDEVRATVEIGKEIIEVHIISPLKYDYVRSLHMSFFSRNNWLKDENKVKAIVHRILTELYYDYAMVKLRKDDLVAHSRGYKSFRESFLEQERERTLVARKECAMVSRQADSLNGTSRQGNTPRRSTSS